MRSLGACVVIGRWVRSWEGLHEYELFLHSDFAR